MYYNYPDEYGFPVLEESELNIFEIAYRSIYDDVEKSLLSEIDEEYALLKMAGSEE